VNGFRRTRANLHPSGAEAQKIGSEGEMDAGFFLNRYFLNRVILDYARIADKYGPFCEGPARDLRQGLEKNFNINIC